MKIDHGNMSGAAAGESQRAALDRAERAGHESRKPSEAGAEAGFSSDQIQLSELGRQLRLLAMESPERSGRLEKLALEVQSGRYQVDAREVSRRLIEDAQGPPL